MTLDGGVNHLCLPIALNNSEIWEKTDNTFNADIRYETFDDYIYEWNSGFQMTDSDDWWLMLSECLQVQLCENK